MIELLRLRVVWHDSIRTTGWRTTDEALADLAKESMTKCESVGFLVGETEERLMLALNHQAIAGSDPTVGETIIIPKGAIIEAWILREDGTPHPGGK